MAMWKITRQNLDADNEEHAAQCYSMRTVCTNQRNIAIMHAAAFAAKQETTSRGAKFVQLMAENMTDDFWQLDGIRYTLTKVRD